MTRAALVAALLFGLAASGCESGCERLRSAAKVLLADAGNDASSQPITAPNSDAAAIASEPPDDPAAERKAAWLRASLVGRDNDVAAFRFAQITPDPKLGFRLFVKNQFALVCGLSFDPGGRPFEATGCKGEWRAKEATIRFSCTDKPTGELCRAPFTLVSPDGFGTSGALEIVRPFGVGSPPSSPPPIACARVCEKLVQCKKFFFANREPSDCVAACEREVQAANGAARVGLANQTRCLIEVGRRCEDLVTCGSVRSGPR